MSANDDAELHRRVTALFLKVCDLPPEEQEAALPADDPEVATQVLCLLAKGRDAASFLDEPALGTGFREEAGAALLTPDARLAGTDLGQYRLASMIASGGMGTVYKAEQTSPHLTVAVKVMKDGLATGSARRRFEYEAEVLARLRHPGIAQIHAAATCEQGDAAGLPYFVMEYVHDARPITQYARELELGVDERLALFTQVCDAVHHGHQKGVIHRDLKPDNILVDGQGRVKIIDFGVACATDSDTALTTLRTDIGQLIGTLQYMSPEQCAADPHDIDTRSDVYSLGVVLYELLGDVLPYDVSRMALHEAVRVIQETDPKRLSSIRRVFRGDLETIALKALQKDRDRRYHSVADLGSDIHRFLSVEPIEARAPSALYKLSKLARRHRTASAAVVVVLLALIGAVVVSALALSREAEQRRIAELQRDEADRQRRVAEFQRDEGDRQRRVAEAVSDFLRNDLLRAVSPGALGHDVTMLEVLDAASDNLRGQFDDDDPFVAATIHHTIALTYFDLGALKRAEKHFTHAIDSFEQTAGPDAIATLEAKTDLASVYENTSRYDAAEAVLGPVLETSRRVYGQHHTRTASALTQLGHVALSRGDYEKAEEFHREALPIYQSLIGEREPDTARALSNLAMSLRYQYRFSEAEPLYEQAMAILREKMGEDHPETLLIENNLGSFYFATRQYQRAVDLFEPLVDKLRRILPADSPRTLQAEANLAMNLNMAGRSGEALELFRDLLPRMREVLGPVDYYTLAAANNLAGLYRDLDRFDEAESLFLETIAQMNELWDDPHDFLMETKGGLAQLFVKQQRLAEAELLYREILAYYGEKHTPHHRTNVLYRRDLVRLCLLPSGKYQEAEDVLLGLHGIATENYGPTDPRTVSIRQILVTLYELWEKNEQADQWRSKLSPDDTPASGNK